ncbi:PqqD family protein [Phycisphaerales bacterium AB-hyl4]|uniref:PqqD family protein n=1 Tax=Natronomicrosphaera hydrolytica TaxID=3242702 RepID=A0ABV4U9X9_9BACT
MSQRPPRMTNEMLLDAIPVVNQAVKARQHGKAMELIVPLRQTWWMGPPLSWVFPFREERRIALDAVGQEVWRSCNGRRTTEQIIERFANKYNVRFHDARLAVTQFLRSLLERNLVALVLPEQDSGQPSAGPGQVTASDN